MENKKSYYAIIPADVRYNSDLTPNAKLLYGEITALCNEKGYCWASNKYFADLYDKTETSVSLWVSQLRKLGFIEVEVSQALGNERKIFLAGAIKENLKTSLKNLKDPSLRKLKDNNTSSNNTFNQSRFNYLEDSKFQTTFADFQLMRKKIKRPLTDRAVELVLEKLHKEDIKVATKMLENSIENCWQGVFPLREEEISQFKSKPKFSMVDLKPITEEQRQANIRTLAKMKQPLLDKIKS